jgi:hypothetical protein
MRIEIQIDNVCNNLGGFMSDFSNPAQTKDSLLHPFDRDIHALVLQSIEHTQTEPRLVLDLL